MKTVLTYGTFDLLHQGHLNLLLRARSMGDRLIVGLSTDKFNRDKIINYDEEKINELLTNHNIIRNKLKIKASIKNAKIFKQITNEYKTFYNYLKTFTNDKTLYEINNTRNNLSDAISKDLKKRGMSFIGTTIIYSYLQAIGIIYSHDKQCFMYKEK